MRLLRAEPAARAALVARASTRIGFPEAFVEKDYWLTEALRSLVRPLEISEAAPAVIFKGGTSLSKAYRLIDRMSEDIDILLGFPSGSSLGGRDRVLKHLVCRIADDLDIGQAELLRSTTGVKRHVKFSYGGAQHDAVREGLLLEMGTRGGTSPTEDRILSSYVAECALEERLIEPGEYADLTPITVSVLDPVRTLFEKVGAVHDAASRLPDAEAAERLSKSGRHYYDIERLLSRADIREKISVTDLHSLVADIEASSQSAGYTYSPRPPGGYADSPAFFGSAEARRLVEPSYKDALELVIPGRYKPTLDKCLSVVREHRSLL